MKIDTFLNTALAEVLDHTVATNSIQDAAGGMINKTVFINSSKGKFFLKWNDDPSCKDLFEKESLGLDLLREGPLRTPNVIGHGAVDKRYFLVLECIENGPPDSNFWPTFGSKLAEMHMITDELFGLSVDNHIGKLNQYNNRESDWSRFFVERRLLPQLKLAADHGLITSELSKKFDVLFTQLDGFFPEEQPALIHGDLWSGNFMIDSLGKPVIFDPAVYFANREMEIAFTKLFGGFDRNFYRSYQDTFPLEDKFDERVDVYNLYPLLVHVNLFGTSYLSGITQTLKRFL